MDVPNFYGVPSKGWIEKAYDGETTKKLKDILNLPIITENDKIQAIKKDFPKETMLTGIIHNEKIILVEGMHRACAIASWDKEKPFHAKVLIALAKWNQPNLPTTSSGYAK